MCDVNGGTGYGRVGGDTLIVSLRDIDLVTILRGPPID